MISCYLVRKAMRYLMSLFLIITLIFLIPRMMPGDPFMSILGEEVYYKSPDLVKELKSQYGLDRPLPEQYLTYLKSMSQGDLGYSFHYMQPVRDVISFKLKWTLVILVPALILGALLGILAGSMAGGRAEAWTQL
jgi:peptide/nickel transport system permease protein